MKQYYKCIRFYGKNSKINYWHGDTNRKLNIVDLFGEYDFIIPLGAHKPKNVSRETIYEF